jgi:hypothetical protein
MFNAAIAHGLSGRIDACSRLLLNCAEGRDDDAEWARKIKTDANQLAILIKDQERFRGLISERVQQTRELQKLPDRIAVDFAENRAPDAPVCV